MTVDPSNGDIFVTGEGPGAAGQDYFVVKYDKELNQDWVSTYNGPGNGDDTPADIIFDASSGPEYVVVTGTSPGIGTGLDIATVATNAPSGTFASLAWPDAGDGDGVRRYNGEEDGDDRAVELSPITIAEIETPPGLSVLVLGTSFGGSSKGDDYTTHVWSGPGSSLLWEQRYNNGGEDVASGLSVETTEDGSFVYVTGYSENATTSFGPTGPGDFDYATVHYTWDGTHMWTERFNYLGGNDIPCDITAFWVESGLDTGMHVWVTGAGMNGANSDVVTVEYVDDLTPPRAIWSDGWSAPSTNSNYGRAIAVYQGEPYVAGSVVHTNVDDMLALSYYDDPPGYTQNWYRTWRSGSFTPGTTPNHEGRGIVVVPVDAGATRSIYITGVARAAGEGRQFATWRYKE